MIYRALSRSLDLEKLMFKGTAERGITIGECEEMSGRIKVIMKFVMEAKDEIGRVSVDQEYFTPDANKFGGVQVPKDLKHDAEALFVLLSRITQGMEILKVFIYSDKVMKSLSKDL